MGGSAYIPVDVLTGHCYHIQAGNVSMYSYTITQPPIFWQTGVQTSLEINLIFVESYIC